MGRGWGEGGKDFVGGIEIHQPHYDGLRGPREDLNAGSEFACVPDALTS